MTSMAIIGAVGLVILVLFAFLFLPQVRGNRSAHGGVDYDHIVVDGALIDNGVVDHPAVLVENFTWGWIYRHHERGTPELRRHGDRLDEFVARVDLHLQSEPACQTTPGGAPNAAGCGRSSGQ